MKIIKFSLATEFRKRGLLSPAVLIRVRGEGKSPALSFSGQHVSDLLLREVELGSSSFVSES